MRKWYPTLRRWQKSDAPFTAQIRNHPALMKFYRQNEPVTVEMQEGFIEYDHLYNKYFGHIIEINDIPIGIANVKDTGEFGLAILPEYCTDLIIQRVLEQLGDGIWSEIFIGDPRLGLYLYKCGFKVSRVKEKAYYKKDIGFVDVVEVKR